VLLFQFIVLALV